MVWRAYIKVLIILTTILWVGSSSASTLLIKDKLERVVEIKVPVKKAVIVISYEFIPALNLWEQVIGVSRWAEEHCDLYQSIINSNPKLKRQTVGAGSDMNVEAVLKLNPDIVITWTYNPDTIRFLEEKGIKVIGIYPDSLNELYDVMRMHGKLFEKEKRTEEVIKEMEKIFSLIKSKVKKIPSEKRKKVIHLGGKPSTVSCGVGVTNDVISMIGGINPASHIKQRNIDVSIERIIQWNPDVIFIWGNAGYTAQSIMQSSQWRFIKAVKDGRVYKAPEWSTWSPRLAPIALWMAMKTYPEYFSDINFDMIADAFYKTVFGISYEKLRRRD